MPIQQENIVKRTGWLTAFLALLLLTVAVRISYIQIKDGKKYQQMADEIAQKVDTIYANKGNVYSADGSLLATSMFRYEIRMDVVTIDDDLLRDSLSALSKKMGQFFGEHPDYYQKKIKRAKEAKDRYLFIARNLNYTDYQTIKSFPIFNQGANKGGFITIQNTVREHPFGKIAQRTIGYDDYRGAPGIEGAFATELRGKNGMRLKQKIAKGQWKPISDFNEVEPQDGKDIITTIDVNMQDIVHHALLKQLIAHNAQHGTAVVMEVATGEVKAIVNLGKTKDSTYYEDRNYAVYESFEPGSTFKTVSMLIALEDKVIDTAQTVDTSPGFWKVGGKLVRDSDGHDYGTISYARALELSSNVGFAKMIYNNYSQNPKKFLSGIKRIGLDQKLDVSIKGEGTPFFPEPRTKNWSGTSLAWMSFGYGIHVTPLQMLTFYNAIANNGVMVRPKFVKEVSYQNNKENTIKYPTEIINPKIASEETLIQIKNMLKNVVKNGTAKNIYSPDYSLAGKTGTSKANYWTSNPSFVSSFAGFFPAENPKYSCIVVVHIPNQTSHYGSVVAGPVFQRIAQKIYATTSTVNKVKKGDYTYKSLDNKFRSFDEIKKKSNVMPNVKGMSGMDAVTLLENMDLNVQFQGTGKVLAQSIVAGTPVKKGNVIYLTNQ